MPKQEQIIQFKTAPNETVLAIAYQAFKNIGWDVLFAGADTLLGSTPKKWNNKGQEIRAGFNTNNEFEVISEMINGESFDITGINKKNIAAFESAFKNAENSVSADEVELNKQAIILLQQQTAIAAEQETKDAEEINKAMNLAGSNLYVTYGIIILNVIVFALMAYDGAGIFEPNGLVHIKWGSNFSPLTLSGDWWRLLSCTFIHFGVIHLAMNMYCLYTIGIYLEPMLGKVKYVAAYLCTGILSSITSLWWHTEPANSVGESGAVFGLYGLFLALLTTDLIPKKVRASLLQSIGIFIVFNLVYGMKGGIDNSAHVGGLLSGFIIGYLYVISIKSEKSGLKSAWVLPLVFIGSLGVSFLFLSSHTVETAARSKVLSEIKEGGYADNDKFDETYNKFVEHQKTALAVFSDTAATGGISKEKITAVSLPEWAKAATLARQMQQMKVSPTKHKKADAVLEYINLREEEANIYINILNNDASAPDKLIEIRKQLDETVDKING